MSSTATRWAGGSACLAPAAWLPTRATTAVSSACRSSSDDGLMRYLSTLAVLAALAIGCKQEVMCPALGNCGGPPPINLLMADPGNPDRSQQWILAPGHPSCTEDLYLPAREGRLAGANVPV